MAVPAVFEVDIITIVYNQIDKMDSQTLTTTGTKTRRILYPDGSPPTLITDKYRTPHDVIAAKIWFTCSTRNPDSGIHFSVYFKACVPCI